MSLLAGGAIGIVASFVPMIFGPLVFPQSIDGPTLGENIVGLSIPAFFLVFGTLGFLLVRWVLDRHVDHNNDIRRTFT